MEALLQWIEKEEQQMFSDAWSLAMLKDTLQYEYNHIYVIYEEAKDVFCCSIKACKAQTDCLRGYVIVNNISGTSELLRIGIDAAYRKQGFATCLMKWYLEQVDCAQYLLEVRASNRKARMLYEKLGYSTICTRYNYYSNPNEDGIVYERFAGQCQAMNEK